MHAARNIICEAYKQKMTQKQGYVWFLPGWYADDWYDLDMLRQDDTNNLTYNGDGTNIEESTLNMDTFLPNCTTAEMVEVRKFLANDFKSIFRAIDINLRNKNCRIM